MVADWEEGRGVSAAVLESFRWLSLRPISLARKNTTVTTDLVESCVVQATAGPVIESKVRTVSVSCQRSFNHPLTPSASK